MPAPPEILELVTRFEQQLAAYKSGTYNETQLRRDFLDPFFKSLGWDMDNSAGYAEAYRDVIHEDAVKIGGLTKAPDYGFRIGGTRKFFLEAKKPSVVIRDEIPPAYQLRRYAWNAKLPLSILSDFEEFAVYDGRIKPRKDEPAATARVFYCTFRDYAEQWDWIASIFSREAVLKGSFDRYAESHRTKRGTTEVDVDFLATIEGWRTDLANNLALRNPKLSQRELNFAVQRILDRIIFLRICEDRGIEDYGRLLALTNGPRIYARLRELFTAADARYNSGLFHFQPEKGRDEPPDELTLNLEVDDKLLRDLFKGLYYPDSPYEFRIISSDILGQVYEQFLGKVIRLTEGHRAKVEDKPEVKKAGGVYYTPTYIVDYIVQQTVGKLLDDCTRPSRGNEARAMTKQSGNANAAENGQETTASTVPPAHFPTVLPALSARDATRILERVSKLRILDPACGSGSFLIGAYQLLLDWHLRFYLANEPERWAKAKRPALVQTTKGWRLTIEERKRILLAHIYGVDIDAQAVEVTKLSLLLKVLEGETGQSLQPLFSVFHERALPDLGRNIKCGNSLIGPDFYQQAELPLLTDEERYRLNVFDWHAEFPEIFQAGGFDAVIGNPPYVRQESLSELKSYFEQHYEAFDGVADLYTYFMEKGVKLLRDGGLYSIIVSSSFLRATYGEPLRRSLKKHTAVVRIVDFGGLPVFANAKDTYVCIPLMAKGAKQVRVEIAKVTSLKGLKLVEYVATNRYTIPNDRLSAEAWSLKSDEEAAVFGKLMKAGKPLGQYVERKFFRGLLTGLNEAFEITWSERAALLKPSSESEKLIKPFLGGQDIRRYYVEDDRRFLIVIPCGWTRAQMARTKKGTADGSERSAWGWFSDRYPKLASHLASFADALKKRQDQGDYWWELRPCDYYQYLDAPKIIFPDICKSPRFSVDRSGIYLANTAYCLGTAELYLLGILNSRLFWFAIANISIPFGVRAGEFRYRLIYQYMEKIPIRVIDRAKKSDVAAHDRIVKLVESMLELHRQLPTLRTPQEKTAMERQIAATDSQIDRLVYDLYGLTEEEIAIVEGRDAIVAAPQSVADSSEPSDLPERDGLFAEPPVPPSGDLTPEKAYGDAAHFYSANEASPPYRTD
ncbi:MAG TPA: TaqI-like C-terminal specificity domain-containing protein [Verrucomicrobiota bacterium]|nr:restriction endonuclease subunit R [Verrucomicrobiales bacterium]HRI11820.1 TaqI-like C-terminal specificity domain-containing protein [Verrucomicrobiota bacterium]